MITEKYNYKILPEIRLIIKYYRGTFSVEDCIACMEETGKDILYDPTFCVINDFMDAELGVNNKEIHDFINYIKGHKILYGKRKIAFLTRTPNQTVFALLLNQFKNETLININTFSTLSAVTNWFGISPADSDTIKNYINELRNQHNSSFIELRGDEPN